MSDAVSPLVAENLCRVYEKRGRLKTTRLEVLKSVSATFGPAELVAVMGPSGAGKTTLLNLLSGIDEPSSGRVLWWGKAIKRGGEGVRARLRNRRIGLVFQFYNLLNDLTALENVMLPARIRRIWNPGAKKRARMLLDEVRLSQRESHYPLELSGGEMQRVAIARALMNDPEVILCDEPTGNLDSRHSEQIRIYLKSLVTERKKTVVIVTHDDRISGIADRTIQLVDGAVTQVSIQGTRGAVRSVS
ncbi:MAG: ABC transporter ATP-binding protein [Candidatus Omnitrophica bacterium]|nr:ABC transporter ATP-binding protein [Candidatus Omnitrophota bacterium]